MATGSRIGSSGAVDRLGYSANSSLAGVAEVELGSTYLGVHVNKSSFTVSVGGIETAKPSCEASSKTSDMW